MLYDLLLYVCVLLGDLDHTNFHVGEPMTGQLLIKKCAVDIKSIELQLVRVESCTYMEGEAREATEIQNIQISDGNIVRGLSIPIFMVKMHSIYTNACIRRSLSCEMYGVCPF